MSEGPSKPPSPSADPESPPRSASPPRPDAAARLRPSARLLGRFAALVLALTSVAFAVRAWSWRLELDPTEALAARLGRALLALQGPDGAFDPHPEDADLPLVRRTGPHALATHALLRLADARPAAAVPGLEAGAEAGLAVLLDRQQPGGTFGGLPPGANNPWPAVDATAQAVLALAAGGRAEDRGALLAATAALVRAAEYGLRDGWTRALAALGLHAAARSGALAEAGGSLGRLLPLAERLDRVDCGDYALAEGVAAGARGLGDALLASLARACLEQPPTWEGQTSDPVGWWLSAWVAARAPGETADAYLAAVERAVGEALDAPPEGRIPGGWFADEVTQTAAGLLAVLEVLEARGRDRGP